MIASRRRRMYGPGSPCSATAVIARPAGWVEAGGSRRNMRASAGMPLSAAASTTS